LPRTLIWDLPTRLFHIVLAVGFGGATIIALALGDDSALFPYHAMLGLTIGVAVVLRIIWGVVGSRYARFGSFMFGPAAVAEYMRGVLTRKGKMYLGHNPGSAYGIFAMLALVLGLAVTGIMLGQGNESVEDLHEILAYVMLAVVGAHVLGVAIHIVSHRENIIASMIHGRKDAEGSNGMSSHGITSTHRVAAALFLLVIGWFLGALIANFDRTTSTTTLPILGTQLRLSEAEGEEGENRGGGTTPAEADKDED